MTDPHEWITTYEVWTDLPGLIAQLRNARDLHSIT